MSGNTQDRISDNEVKRRRLLRAVEEIGSCLVSLSIVLIQGIREDNEAHRGSIAVGLDRAAALCRGAAYNYDTATAPLQAKSQIQAPLAGFTASGLPLPPPPRKRLWGRPGKLVPCRR